MKPTNMAPMRPFAIAVRVGLVALVALHVLFLGGTQFVCRYSHKVMNDCCCPQDKPSEQPELRKACCCDVRHSGHLRSVSVRTEQPPLCAPTLVVAFAAQSPAAPRTEGFSRRVLARVPDGSDVYLTTRQLLI